MWGDSFVVFALPRRDLRGISDGLAGIGELLRLRMWAVLRRASLRGVDRSPVGEPLRVFGYSYQFGQVEGDVEAEFLREALEELVEHVELFVFLLLGLAVDEYKLAHAEQVPIVELAQFRVAHREHEARFLEVVHFAQQEPIFALLQARPRLTRLGLQFLACEDHNLPLD